MYDLRKQPRGILREHAERGSRMIYFSVAMLVVAIVIAVLRVLEGRSEKRRVAANVLVAIPAVAVGISSMITVYRIGDSGAHSVWGGEIARLTKANGGFKFAKLSRKSPKSRTRSQPEPLGQSGFAEG